MKKNMNSNFITEFNKLDVTCQKYFSSTVDGKNYKAIYAYKKTLNKINQNLLQNIIDIRNIISHERFDFIEIKQDAVDITRSFVAGLNRIKDISKFVKIDAGFELQRSKNLLKMSEWINIVKKAGSKTNLNPNNVIQKLEGLIQIERTTFDYETLKSNFHKAKDIYESYSHKYKSEKKEKNLDKYKKAIINDIIAEYYSTLSYISPLNLFKRRQAKNIKEDFLFQLSQVNDKSSMDDVLEASLESFDELI